jgi:hypothetical protein
MEELRSIVLFLAELVIVALQESLSARHS